MPLKILATLWAVSLALFFLDLYDAYADAPNGLLLFAFMLVNILILLAVDRVRVRTLPPVMERHRSAKIYFFSALVVSMILLPIDVRVYTGSSLAEFANLFADPASAYAKMQRAVSADRAERLGFLLGKLTVSWLTVALVPLAIILKKNNQIGLKIFVTTLLLATTLSVFRGTDKEVADVMIFLIGGLYLSARVERPKPEAERFGVGWQQKLLLAIVGSAFLYLFFFRKSERLANVQVHCFQNTNVCFEYGPISETPFGFLVALLYRYITHGYYGLAISFDARLSTCPFIGDSRVMQYIFGRFGVECRDTVMEQLNSLGWTSRGSWSTGFTQLADNFGHLGVFFYILFFALALKIYHQTHAKTGCYLAGILFLLNFFILFYMIGNLQLQQVGQQYFGYIFLNLAMFVMVLVKQARRT